MDRLNQNYCWSFSGIKRKFAFYHSSIQEINAHQTICNKRQQSPVGLNSGLLMRTQLSLVRWVWSCFILLTFVLIQSLSSSFILQVFLSSSLPAFLCLIYLFYFPPALPFPLDRLSFISAACFYFIAPWGLAVNQSLTGSCSRTEWVTGADLTKGR